MGDFLGFVGRSEAMKVVYERINTFCGAPLPVLITGETGTGKELVAEALHELSRPNGFEALNCAALPESLVESELFGHVRGAFTGAVKDHHGVIRRADGGTLFLDEIGELPLDVQAKLLRCLETYEFRPVGAERTRRSEFRLLAATNRDLEAMVGTGEFREDLWHRLGIAVIHVPPLRRRTGDIPALARHFLTRFWVDRPAGSPAEFDPGALACLTHYDWPGNVRELRHVVETASAMTSGDRVTAPVVHSLLSPTERDVERILTLAEARAEADRQAVEVALAATDGNREKAAQHLGISVATLYRLLAGLREERVDATAERDPLPPPRPDDRRARRHERPGRRRAREPDPDSQT